MTSARRWSLVVVAMTTSMIAAGGSLAAEPAPAPLPPAAQTCATALGEARDRLTRVHRSFRRATVDGFGPVIRPRGRAGLGRKPVPGLVRHGWAASASLQRNAVPEYFYVDIVDLRDDRGGWSAVAGDDAWSCVDRGSRDQRNLDCVRRRGDHVAIVRAIHWHRVTPRHVEAYLEAFKAAAEACLATPP